MNDISSFFKAYDIRGAVADGLDAAFALCLGNALGSAMQPARVVAGYDARLSSPELAASLMEGLAASGAAVTNAGLCGTEEIYYAAAFKDFDLGVMVTASHNPAGENGFKIVRSGAVPVDLATGLAEIRDLMQSGSYSSRPGHGAISDRSFRGDYLNWLLDYCKNGASWGRAGLHIVADAGNGCAGPLLEALRPWLVADLIVLNSEPDGSFPNGVPNPLLPEMRERITRAISLNKADIGIAFDGDFDRCFFFDEYGRPVESCYLACLLAEELLTLHPAEIIVHDPRVYWALQETVRLCGSKSVLSKGGHSHMKAAMRKYNALYGAEMSGHHFYRDFSWCDSGMLTMLLVLSLLQRNGRSLAEMTGQLKDAWPCSGELNFRVTDTGETMRSVWVRYAPEAVRADKLDGIGLEFQDWRFNLRPSNTEPLLRLNVEACASRELVEAKTLELATLIRRHVSE